MQEIDSICNGAENVFQTLDGQLKSRPEESIALVHSCQTEFNNRSARLQCLGQKMQLLKNESALFHKLIETPMILSVKQPNMASRNISKYNNNSRSPDQSATVPTSLVCRFPT